MKKSKCTGPLGCENRAYDPQNSECGGCIENYVNMVAAKLSTIQPVPEDTWNALKTLTGFFEDMVYGNI